MHRSALRGILLSEVKGGEACIKKKERCQKGIILQKSESYPIEIDVFHAAPLHRTGSWEIPNMRQMHLKGKSLVKGLVSVEADT